MNNASSNFPGLSLKAWAIFAGTTGTVAKSSGVTSITRNSGGNYSVVFPASTFLSTNYIMAAVVESSNSSGLTLTAITNPAKTALACVFQTLTPAAAPQDAAMIYVAWYE